MYNQNIEREATQYRAGENATVCDAQAKYENSGQGGCGALSGSDWIDPRSSAPLSEVEAFSLVGIELADARRTFPPMVSAHEGWAIIMEEVDELWSEVKQRPGERDLTTMRKEAVQIAAMALRFLLDVRG